MEREGVFDFLNSDADFFPTKELKQRWSRSGFRYLDSPRPDYGLMLLTKGKVDFKTEQMTVSASEGDVIFLPKDCYYEAVFYNESCNVENYLINFDTRKQGPRWQAPIKLFENALAPFESRFDQNVADKMKLDHSPLYRRARLYLLLDLLLEFRKTKSLGRQSVIRRAQALLLGDEDLPVEKIAQLCCTSESGLRRLFKESLGMSPVQYKLNARINQAKNLLDSTDMTVDQMAEQLHFFDAAHFCKAFRAHVGVTPKQYVKNKKL